MRSSTKAYKPYMITSFFLAFALILIGSALKAQASDNQSVTLRVHQFLPSNAGVPQHVITKWIDDVSKASNGRIKFQRFPSMSLGGTPPELYDQAVDGVADVIWTLSGYTPGRFPEAEVFELPFMMNSSEAMSRAYWQLAQDTLINDEMADTHVLGLWVHGPGIIHSKKPIRAIDDLKGVKLRAPTRVITKLFKNLGAESISMPVPAVPENLAKGVIDGTAIPWEVAPGLKIPELVNNHTEFPGNALYSATFIFTMNKAKYQSLPDDLKAAIDSASGLAFSAYAGRKMQEIDAIARANIKSAGNNIIELSDDEIKTWRQASQSTIDEWVVEMNNRGIDGQAILDKARALILQNE